MEILNKVNDLIRKSKTGTFSILNMLFIICILIHYIYFEQSNIKNVERFIYDMIMLLIIYIWFYSSSKIRNNIENLENAFKTSDYKAEYDKYKERLYQFKHFRFYKLIFILIWGSGLITLIYVGYKVCFFENNALGWFGIGTLIGAMLLNFSSYYNCCAYVYFIRQVSNTNIEEAEYNIFYPSETSGIQKFLPYYKINTFTFLFVSFLFTVSQILIAYSSLNKSNSVANLELLIISGTMTLLLGFGTFVVIFIVPHFFLNRILYKFKQKSLIFFENEMKNEISLSGKEAIAVYIKNLNNDRLKYGIDMVSFTVAVTTTALNVMSVTQIIIKYYNSFE